MVGLVSNLTQIMLTAHSHVTYRSSLCYSFYTKSPDLRLLTSLGPKMDLQSTDIIPEILV